MNSNNHCPVCGELDHASRIKLGDFTEVDCERCGKFRIVGSAEMELGDPHESDGLLNSDIKKASVGHWLRQGQRHGDSSPILRSDVARRLAAKPWFPSLRDQRELLLRLLGDKAGALGESVGIGSVEHQYTIGARSPASVDALLSQLAAEGLVKLQSIDEDYEDVTLTFPGWLQYEPGFPIWFPPLTLPLIGTLIK